MRRVSSMSSSSRASSPASSDAIGVALESPRTKFKRELAAFDSSSEEEDSAFSRTRGPSQRKFPVSAKSEAPLKQASPAPPGASECEDENKDESEEDEIVVKPRGRLASRMRAIQKSNTESEVAESVASISEHQAPVQSSLFTTCSPKLIRPPVKAASCEDEGSADGSGVEDSLPPLESSKFDELVAVRQAERKAEAEAEAAENEEEVNQARKQGLEAEIELNLDLGSSRAADESDEAACKKQKRGAMRKASKKAKEEMSREIQRIDRDRQLAHQCQTKKKINKSALFERFNFPASGAGRPVPKIADESASAFKETPTEESPSVTHVPDIDKSVNAAAAAADESKHGRRTKPTLHEDFSEIDDQDVVFPGLDDDLPSLQDFMSKKVDKGKGRAFDEFGMLPHPSPPPTEEPKFRVKLPAHLQSSMILLDDDDDDNIPPTKPNTSLLKLDAQLARLPKKGAGSEDPVLDRLIHAVSPGKQRGAGRRREAKGTMTGPQLQWELLRRAKEQARQEREHRNEMLKAKGVLLETEEDRRKLEQQPEDMVERARREAAEIKAREKEEARRERKERREANPLALDDDESDDESYVESGSDRHGSAIELSGSEDDDELSDVSQQEGLSGDETETLEQMNEKNSSAAKESDDEAVTFPATKRRHRSFKPNIASDDEDGGHTAMADVAECSESTRSSTTPFKVSMTPCKATLGSSPNQGKMPTSVLRSATKPFIPGLPVPLAAPAGLSLTQIFRGTMDDSQQDGGESVPFNSTEPMPSIAERLPMDSQLATQTQHESWSSQVNESADEVSQPVDFQLGGGASQLHGLDSLWPDEQTQVLGMGMGIAPSQDQGFINFTPLEAHLDDEGGSPPMAASASVDKTVPASPITHGKGRLRRGRNGIASSSITTAQPATKEDEVEGEDEMVIPSTIPTDTSMVTDAGATMRKVGKRAEKHDRYNKKKSAARGLVEEQAEESDDEYAGLGGGDGSESDSDMDNPANDSEMAGMIDDNSPMLTADDERALAAFHADREREQAAKQVDRLFRDITTGALRKRKARGDGYDDLDDDDGDDVGEYERRRRAAKRRYFLKMQRELFEDERVEVVARNPKSAAFLRSLNDTDDVFAGDEDADFLADIDVVCPGNNRESQSQSQENDNPEASPRPSQHRSLRAPTTTKLTGPVKGPKHHPHRPGFMVKPRSMTAIRDSLQELLDEPDHMSSSSASRVVSDNEDDDDKMTHSSTTTGAIFNKENTIVPVGRKSATTAGKAAVIDRISLSRQGSFSAAASGSGSTNALKTRLAFASATTDFGPKRVPALLRRATTNSSLFAEAGSSGGAGKSRAVNTGSGGNNSAVTRGGGGSESPGLGSPHSDGGSADGKLLLKRPGTGTGVTCTPAVAGGSRDNAMATMAEREDRRIVKRKQSAEARRSVYSGLFNGETRPG